MNQQSEPPSAARKYSFYELALNSRARRVRVKDGFCWPVVFFGPFWAFSHGMWAIGLGLLFFAILVNLLTTPVFLLGGLGAGAFYILTVLVFLIWIGKYANTWLRNSLEKKGYELIDEATFQARIEAERATIKQARIEAKIKRGPPSKLQRSVYRVMLIVMGMLIAGLLFWLFL